MKFNNSYTKQIFLWESIVFVVTFFACCLLNEPLKANGLQPTKNNNPSEKTIIKEGVNKTTKKQEHSTTSVHFTDKNRELPFIKMDNEIEWKLHSTTKFELTHKLSNRWRLKNTIRYFIQPESKIQSLQTDLIYQPRISFYKFRLNIRARVQHTLKENSDGNNNIRKQAVPGVKLKWKGDTFRPFIKLDTAWQLNKKINQFNRLRSTFGIDLKLRKNHFLRFEYTLQKTLNTLESNASGIGAINYSFSL